MKNIIIIIFIILILPCCAKINNQNLYNYDNKNLSIDIPDEWLTTTSNFNKKNILLYSKLSYDNSNTIEIYKNNSSEYTPEGLIDIINNFSNYKNDIDKFSNKLLNNYNKKNNAQATKIPIILTSIDNIKGLQDGTIFKDKDIGLTYYIIVIDIPLKKDIYTIIISANSLENLSKEFDIIKTIKFINK